MAITEWPTLLPMTVYVNVVAGGGSPEVAVRARQLLQLTAIDCCKMGSFILCGFPEKSHIIMFLYHSQAFDVLERLDPAPEYLEGKKGACIGTFQVRQRT